MTRRSMVITTDLAAAIGVTAATIGLLAVATHFGPHAGRPSSPPDSQGSAVAVSRDPAAVGTGGMWVSAAELARKPMTGRAWDNLLSVADEGLGPVDVTDIHSIHDVRTLAAALVYARTGEAARRRKVASAIATVMNGDDRKGLVHAWARNLVSYIIAAELIDLDSFDPALDGRFRTWLDALRRREFVDGTLVNNDERRANNHGRYAGATRAAIAIYLGDQAEVERCAHVFRGFLGDRKSYAGFRYQREMSWHADANKPVGVNPLGAEIKGHPVDGMLPEEMRRGGAFRVPPRWTDYPWEGLQGAVVEAVLLSRQGYDAFEWGDRAILRAVERLHWLARTYPADPWWADGDELFVVWIVNDVYGTEFPAPPLESPRGFGDNSGFTDWTHGPDAPQ